MNSNTLKADYRLLLCDDIYEHPFFKGVINEFGPKGFAVSIAILLTLPCYGLRCPYCYKFREDITRKVHDVSVNLVSMVVKKMLKSGLLDQACFDSDRFLVVPARYISDSMDEVRGRTPFCYVNTTITDVFVAKTPFIATKTTEW